MAMVLGRSCFHELPAELKVLSAGISPVEGQAASAHAQFVASQKGFDLSDHSAGGMGKVEIESADLVLTMTQSQRDALRRTFVDFKGKIFSLAEFAGMGNEDLEDPFGAALELYEKSYQQLEVWIEAAVPALRLLMETKQKKG